ncbi:MAG: hypothetical protein Q8N15_07850, partial [Bacillota bacterium]|nr:hypothetical protein [Bacillota bacterium]
MFCVIATNACTANPSDPDRYIVFQTVSYIEKGSGIFAHGEDEIYVSVYVGSIVFTSSFSDATVFVHTDGSLSATYPDHWNATCPADASVDGCTISRPNEAHTVELASLIGFRDVVILSGTVDPQIDEPDTTGTTARIILFWSIVGIIVGYRLLMILLHKGGRGFLAPSGSLRAGRVYTSRNAGESVKNYWLYKAEDTIETIHADRDDRYGKNAGKTPPPPVTTLAERIRAKWPYLLLA